MLSSPRRSEKLDLRLTPGAKQTLQRAAAAAQRSMSKVVLESALASAAETLADRQSFQLDEQTWEAFVAALDAPPQVHPRLARLAHQFSDEATGGTTAKQLLEFLGGRIEIGIVWSQEGGTPVAEQPTRSPQGL